MWESPYIYMGISLYITTIMYCGYKARARDIRGGRWGRDSWKFSLQNRVIMAGSGPLECWLGAAAIAERD